MQNCPACGEQDPQIVRSSIKKVGAGKTRQVDTRVCTRCEYEWHADPEPAMPLQHSSDTDF
jgi:transposase